MITDITGVTVEMIHYGNKKIPTYCYDITNKFSKIIKNSIDSIKVIIGSCESEEESMRHYLVNAINSIKLDPKINNGILDTREDILVKLSNGNSLILSGSPSFHCKEITL
jgi:hypothetical protein